jgi:hypothetical protein
MMQQQELRRGVRLTRQRGGLSILVGVGLGALIFGVVLMTSGLGDRVASTQPASRPIPQVRAPTAQVAGQQQAHRSPRALKQYRDFYAQQMTSEAILEQWAQPAEPDRELSARQTAREEVLGSWSLPATAAVSPQKRAFYAQQMALEADLERWSGPAPAHATPEAMESVPHVPKGPGGGGAY